MTNPNGARAADNALKAIETALQELASAGITQAHIDARWGVNVTTVDPTHVTAIKASLGRRGVN